MCLVTKVIKYHEKKEKGRATIQEGFFKGTKGGYESFSKETVKATDESVQMQRETCSPAEKTA